MLCNQMNLKQRLKYHNKATILTCASLRYAKNFVPKCYISLENKLLVYKAVIKPIWPYGIELWGCASKSNTAIIQRSQPKILRTITNAPRYVTNHTLHTDLNIPYVSEVINERINKHLNKSESHPNPLLETLTQPMSNRRLKRRWTSDLQDWGDIVGWPLFQYTITRQQIGL